MFFRVLRSIRIIRIICTIVSSVKLAYNIEKKVILDKIFYDHSQYLP